MWNATTHALFRRARVGAGLADAGNGHVGDSALSGLPPQRVVDMAKALGVVCEVQLGAQQLGETQLADSLNDACNAMTLQGLRTLRDTRDVVGILTEAGTECVVLKGVGTAAMTRASPLGRRASDVDLLIRPQDVIVADATLEANGLERSSIMPVPRADASFRWYLKMTQEGGYRLGSRSIDVHWQMGFARSWLPSADVVLASAESAEVAGVTLPVPHVAHALVHAVLHWRFGRFAQLKYALDIEGLLDVAQSRGIVVAGLPRPVQSGINMVRAMSLGYGIDADGGIPPGVARSDWSLMTASLVPSLPPDSYLQRRIHAVVRQYQTTPGIVDRAQIPARSAAGPLVRGWQKVRGYS